MSKQQPERSSEFRRRWMRPVWLTLAITFSGSALHAQGTSTIPANGGPAWVAVQQALGGKGTMQPGDVLKFGFPRSDLKVIADGVTLKPTFALGSWVAFKRVAATPNADVMVMGDLVLTEDEVGPVMLSLQQNGVEQTALHNHVLHESPRIMYMHIAAHGDAAKIANAIHTALGQSKTPMPLASAASAAPAPAPAIEIDTVGVAQALGFAGKGNGGVFQFSIPRSEPITDNGMTVPPSMGVATAINFQPT
ncbi:MAG: DUF1259 domain-containing protein, partial [Gemmatimonadaceae bacterium]